MGMEDEFPFGAKGLFSGAFAVSFREGITYMYRKKTSIYLGKYANPMDPWWKFVSNLKQNFSVCFSVFKLLLKFSLGFLMGRDSSAHADLTHLYTQVMCLICAHRSDSSVQTTGFWRLICTHTHTPLGLDMGTWGLGGMGFRGHDIHTFRVRHGDMGTWVGKGTWGLGAWGLGDMVQKTYTPLGLDMGTWVGKGAWGLGDMVQKTYTPLGLDMGTWGLGGMGWTWVGKGIWGLWDMVQKTYTPLGLDMGTWGLGDMGTWGSGDMGFRGHGTEDIHTFRVRHGDMGTWV